MYQVHEITVCSTPQVLYNVPGIGYYSRQYTVPGAGHYSKLCQVPSLYLTHLAKSLVSRLKEAGTGVGQQERDLALDRSTYGQTALLPLWFSCSANLGLMVLQLCYACSLAPPSCSAGSVRSWAPPRGRGAE